MLDPFMASADGEDPELEEGPRAAKGTGQEGDDRSAARHEGASGTLSCVGHGCIADYAWCCRSVVRTWRPGRTRSAVGRWTDGGMVGQRAGDGAAWGSTMMMMVVS